MLPPNKFEYSIDKLESAVEAIKAHNRTFPNYKISTVGIRAQLKKQKEGLRKVYKILERK